MDTDPFGNDFPEAAERVPVYRDTGDQRRHRDPPRWFTLWLLARLRERQARRG